MGNAYYLARMRISAGLAYGAADTRARLVYFELAGRYSVAARVGDASAISRAACKGART